MGKRNRKRQAKALAFLFVSGFLFFLARFLVNSATHVWTSSTGKTMILTTVLTTGSLLLLTLVLKMLIKIKKTQKFQSAMEKVEISEDRSDYFIENEDYRRGNPKENIYRKFFQLSLLETFGNRCAKCGANDNGLDIDHLFFSKNEGGCFLMRHRNGHLVNNAIPLCQSCNRRKSDQSYRNFYSSPEILHLLQRNIIMTKMINESKILDERGKVIKRKSKSA